MNLIGTQNIKSCRKVHTCDYCLNKITVGSPYKQYAFSDGGSMITAKECEVCTSFLKTKENYDLVFDSYGEGYFSSLNECEEYVLFREKYNENKKVANAV